MDNKTNKYSINVILAISGGAILFASILALLAMACDILGSDYASVVFAMLAIGILLLLAGATIEEKKHLSAASGHSWLLENKEMIEERYMDILPEIIESLEKKYKNETIADNIVNKYEGLYKSDVLRLVKEIEALPQMKKNIYAKQLGWAQIKGIAMLLLLLFAVDLGKSKFPVCLFMLLMVLGGGILRTYIYKPIDLDDL